MVPDGDQQRNAGSRILIVGTGGQGVLTAAQLLCGAFVERGCDVVSGQLHGMAQRGGSVQSSVIIDSGISPVIGSGRADCVLGLEPMETARAMPFMSAKTVVYMNVSPVVPYVLGQRYAHKQEGWQYPDVNSLVGGIRDVTRKVFAFDATACAVRAGSSRMLNVVMLGCLLGAGLLPCSAEEFWGTVADTKGSKFCEANAQAFSSGAEIGRQHRLRERKA